MSFQELTAAIYTVVSAPPETRDWESVRPLYHPRATMVRTGIDSAGKRYAKVMSFDEYIVNVSELLKGVTFHEVELRQDVREFGNVAQLTSVYEFNFKSADKQFSGRGINFFNLINDGSGWKIISIVWDNERDGLCLPDWS